MIRTFTGIVSLILILSSFKSQAADYYWVGGTGTWTDLTHWATTSGGSVKRTVVPTSADDVFFDANSFTATGQIVTITDEATFRSMDWTNAAFSPTITCSFLADINVYGSFILPSTVLRDFSGLLHFKATSGSHSVNLGNLPLRNPDNEIIYFEGAGGTWTLTGGVNLSGISLTAGTLNTNGQSVTCSSFGTTGSAAQAINLGASAITVATWNITSTNITINAGTSSITSTFGFNGKNLTYNNLIISGTVSVNGSNTFNAITLNAGSILKLKEGTTQTISNLVSNGTAPSPVTIKSVTDGSVATLSSANAISVNYARIQDNAATGTGTFAAPTGSVDLGNVTGWNITVSEPTVQASSPTFLKVLPTSVDLSWTNGNGTNRIVVVKQGSAVNSPPVDFTTYTAAAFSAGTPIGSGNYVAYVGNANKTTVSGLTAGTLYHFAVYEFSGTGATSNFLTTSPAITSKTTLPATAIIMSNSPVSVCSGQYYDTGGDFNYYYGINENYTQTLTPSTPGSKLKMDFNVSTYDFFLHTGEVLKIYDGANTSAALIGTYTGSTSPGVVTATNAAGQLTIQFTSDATLSSIGFGADISCYVPAPAIQPTVASTALTFSNVTGTSMTLNWANGNGNNRIVLIRSLNAVAFAPVDGTEYVANAAFGGGTNLGSGQYVVYNGTGNTANVSNLSPSTTYYFSVIEYNKDATTTPNYMTTGLTGSKITSAIAAEPTVAATAMTITSMIDVSAEFSVTAGNGVRRVFVIKQGSPVSATPVDGTLYTTNVNFTTATDLGGGNKLITSTSSNTSYVVNLLPSTTYYVAAYEFNGTTAGTPNYLLTSPATTSFTTLPALAPAPTVLPDYNYGGFVKTFTSINLKWTIGNAQKVLIVAQGPAGSGSVTNRTEYTANSVFGQGQSVGTNTYVVYNGSGTEVNVTGLQTGTDYNFTLYGYNGSGITSSYTYSRSTNTSTLKMKPTVQASNVLITNVGADSMKISWQRGNGDRDLVVIRASAPVSLSIKDSTDVGGYGAFTDYGQGFDLGNGNMAIFTSTGTSMVLKKLAPSTTYHVTVYEFNSTYVTSSKYYNYFLTTNAPVANATTPAGKNYYWVQGTGKWSDYQHHWATASGGSAFHATVPSASDNVYFDAASFNTDKDSVYIDVNMYFKDMDWTAITKKASLTSIAAKKCSYSANVSGSLKLSSLMNIDVPYIYLWGTSSGNVINLAGKKKFSTCSGSIVVWGYGGEWTVNEDITLNTLTMYAGSLVIPNSTLTVSNSISFYNSTLKKLELGNSTVNVYSLTGGTDLNKTFINGGKFNFSQGETNLGIEGGQAHFKKVTLQGSNYSKVRFIGTMTIDSLLIAPGRDVQFEAGKTYTIDKLICNGDSTKTTKIRSTVQGSPAFFTKASGKIDINYVVLSDNIAAGGAQFNALNSADGGNVSGWNITNPEIFLPKRSASGIVYLKVLRNDMKIKWVSGDGIRRLLIMKEGSAVDTYPADNKTYTANAAFGSGSDVGNGNFVAYDGAKDTTSITGLTPGKTYHLALLEYNTWNNKIKYKRTSPAISNIATVGAADILFSSAPVTAGNVKYFDDGGNGAYAKGKNGVQTITPATAGTKLGVMFTYFELGVFDSLVVYDGNSISAPVIGKFRTSSAVPSQSLVATNASGALTFRLKGNNSSEVDENFKGWVAEFFNVGSLATEPTVQSTALTVTAKTENTLTLKVTKGNGAGRVIVAHEVNAVSRQPADGLALTGNASFGTGAALGDNNYVVYSGSEDGVVVTGLKPNTIYHFAAVEYNGAASTSNYLLTNGAVIKDTTLIAPPTIASSKLTFSSVGTSSMIVGMITGNGAGRVIVARKSKEVAFAPEDGKTYTGNSTFGVGQNLGDSTYVIYSGSSSTINLSVYSLEMLTRYYVKVFEYNGSSKKIRYQTSQTLSGSAVTSGPTLKMKKVNASYCANGAIEVPFETTNFFKVGNKFTLQLSDAQGNFATPLVLKDTLLTPNSAYKGTIKAKIANTVPSGNLYKMRVISSSPYIVGDSARAIVITNVPDVSVAQGANGFTSSSATNNQWYKNGVAIDGATSQTFSSVGDGSYTVKVTVQGCSKTSAPIVIMGLEETTGNSVVVYPNPVQHELTIERAKESGPAKFLILDTQGRELINGSLNEERTNVDVKSFPQGIFFIKVVSEKSTSITKFIHK